MQISKLQKILQLRRLLEQAHEGEAQLQQKQKQAPGAIL